MQVAAFPTWAQLNQWDIEISQALCAVSPYRDMAEVEWYRKAMAKDATFESLADSGEARFHPLDLILAVALARIIPKDLAPRVRTRQDDAYKKGKVLMGRQMAWIIHDWYRTEEHMGAAYGYRDLMSFHWMGDDKIESYLAQWRHLTGNLEDDIPEKGTTELSRSPHGRLSCPQGGPGPL